MGRSNLPPGLESLTFYSGKNATTDYEAIRKAGGFMAAERCQIRGKVAEGAPGEFRVRQVAAERTVSEQTVAIKRSGKFEVSVSLLRGRNTLTFRSGRPDGPEFEIDLFHRSISREWVESILKALVLVLVVKTFVIQAFFIPTPSMEKTLLRDDYILVEKVSYLFRDARPGEIVVFEYPEDPSKDFIKRLIATEGDVVELKDRQLYLNGRPLDEPYTRYEDSRLFDPRDYRVNFAPEKIKEDHYFVMGDNRDNSKDSRDWGPFPDWQMIGKAWGVYYPLNRIGLISHGLGTPRPG